MEPALSSMRLSFGILLHSAKDEKAIDLDAAYKDYLKIRTTISSKNLSEIHAPMKSSAAGAKVSSI